MQFTFAHNNFNVADLDASLAFYEKALGLQEVRRHATDAFTLVYLGDGVTPHQLELTWLRDHPQKYDLGECEFHLALRAEDYEAAHAEAYDLGENEFHLAFTVDDYAAAHALHKEMGCICFENEAMGIYFIADPDGYWLEIVPARK